MWTINSLSQDMRSAASLIKFITAEAWHYPQDVQILSYFTSYISKTELDVLLVNYAEGIFNRVYILFSTNQSIYNS